MAHMVVKYLIVLRNVVPTLSAVYSTLQHFPIQNSSIQVFLSQKRLLLHFRRFDLPLLTFADQQTAPIWTLDLDAMCRIMQSLTISIRPFKTRARICQPFMVPRNRFLTWRAGTTTLFDVPARQAIQAGGIYSLSSIPGLLKSLQIRAQSAGGFFGFHASFYRPSFICSLFEFTVTLWRFWITVCGGEVNI